MGQRRNAERSAEPAVAQRTQEGAASRGVSRQRWREVVAIVALATMFVPLVAVSAIFNVFGSGERPPAPTAAIVDQLSLTQPNPDFVEAATRTLEQAGYAVDYYPGEQVTVDFYRNLPVHDYELVILRVHSGIAKLTGSPSLFTSEPYSETKYVAEQRASRLLWAHYYDGGDMYFGIDPEFVELSMRGRFDDTLVIMMGCLGLASTDMAQAFVWRGAQAVVSWGGLVSAAHTDAATESLLRDLLVDRLPIPEAVAQTTAEVGPDPEYGSNLLYYPTPSSASALGEAHPAP